MKRFCSMMAAAALLLSGVAAQAEGFQAGTYTATGKGRNGDVTVDVTFSADAIEKVEVVAHQETQGICEAPIEKIPQEIVENQSLAVDAVAGATLTSQAILDAVTQAVEMAGGDPAAMQTKVEKAQSDEVIDKQADVIVVGAGAAGMTASVRLAQKGYHVLLVEKMAFVGGATATCGGGVTAVSTRKLNELGVHNDPAVLENYIAQNGHNLNDPELSHLYAYEIGNALDYLLDQGVGMEYFDGTSPYTRDEYALYNMAGGGAGLAASLKELVDREENVELLLSADAKSLVTDESGRVTGVQAAGTDGTTYNLSAKAVVLATGSYSGSKKIIDENYFEGTINGAPVYLTGDGITMAQEIGAAVNHLEWVEGRANGIMTGEFSGTSLNNQTAITSTTGSIIVNQAGVRVMNEETPSAAQVAIYAQQPDHCLYLVMNQNGYDLLGEKGGFQAWSQKYLYNADDVNAWLEADGMYPLLVKGDSAEEAANAAGLDAQAFAETIAHYNEMVASGEDQDFGHAVTEPIEGTIYILQLRVTHSKDLGGLKANGSLAIVREDGSSIDGLYGAGEVVGGSQGDIETGMLTWCLASGYAVADQIEAELTK